MDYERKTHPDGQISVLIHNKIPHLQERINSYADLFFIKSLCETHEYMFNEKIKTLTIPCLFGQRGDRRFTENGSFDLKLITDFINSCGFERVNIHDTHSDVSLGLIHNSHKISSFNNVRVITENLQAQLKSNNVSSDKIVLCSPDAGAYKKVYDYAEKLQLPIVAANKVRSLDNNITLTFLGDVKDKNILIVDDICSRGGTFIKLAEQLKEQGANKLYLYITHFEGGCNEYKQTIDKLCDIFEKVYTTNTYREFDEDDKKKLNIRYI